MGPCSWVPINLIMGLDTSIYLRWLGLLGGSLLKTKDLRLVIFCFLLMGAATGCQDGAPRIAPPETPVVPVSHPVERDVTDYVDFTGRTDAVQSVNVIARVTGYLVQMSFKQRSEVKAGDLLFEIDPRP